MTHITIENSGGTLECEALSWREEQSCIPAIRDVPLRSDGAYVDTSTFVLKARMLDISLRLSDSEKTTLEAIFNADESVTITATSDFDGDYEWMYTGWFSKKPLIYEYKKQPDATREWRAELEFKIQSFNYEVPYKLFIGLETAPAIVIEVDVATFTESTSETLGVNENYAYALAISGDYLYVATGTSPARIIKIELATFTEVDSLILGTGENNVRALVVSENYLYAGCYTNPVKIAKINLSTFTEETVLTLGSTVILATSLAVSGNYLYVGTYNLPAKIARVNLVTFTEDVAPLSFVSDRILSLVVSGDYLYAGTSTALPANIIKVAISTFTVDDTLALGSGENTAWCLAVSGGYLYVGLSTSPAKIAKVDISTFTEVDVLTLAAGEEYVIGLVVVEGYLYAGLYSLSKITKIDLSTFTKISTLTLSGGNDLWSITTGLS